MEKDFVNALFSNDPSKLNVKKAMGLKYHNLPSSLYKYRAFDKNGHSLELLRTDKMWLSRPADFNDPFDCALKLSLIDFPKEIIIKVLIKPHVNKFKQDFNVTNKELHKIQKNEDPLNELFEVILNKNYPELSIKECDEYIEEEKENIRSVYFDIENKKYMYVACFSEIKDSILMWSHYTKNHKGFCVEYNFRELGINSFLASFIFPVIYSESIFDYGCYLKSPDEEFGNVLKEYFCNINPNEFHGDLDTLKLDENWNNMISYYTTLNKFKDWSYEKEWRFVTHNVNNPEKDGYLIVPKPKAIYLGAMVCKQNCEKIQEIGKERDIPVYKMQMTTSEFTLEPKLIHECNNIQECD